MVFSVTRVACSCAVFRSLLGPQSAYRHRVPRQGCNPPTAGNEKRNRKETFRLPETRSSLPWVRCIARAFQQTQVLSGETRFLRIRAYPEKIGAAARFWSISAHCRTVQYILYFCTFVLLLLLLFYGTSVKFQMLNLSKFVSSAFKFQIFDLSKFVSLAVKFQIFDLSKFVSLAYCCKMQAHSTMRGKRPKIIDVDLLSDVSSPKCHSPKSPRIKEEELDDIEEMQVEAQVEEQAKRQRKEPVAKPAPPTEAPTPPTPYPGPVVSTTPTPLPTAVGNVALPFPDMSQLPLAPLIPQMLDTTPVAMSSNMSLGLPQGMLSQSYTQPLWQPTAMPLAPTTMPLALQMQMQPHLLG